MSPLARKRGNGRRFPVRPRDKDIDPVVPASGCGAHAFQSVLQELRGEKIDIVPYSEDQAKYVWQRVVAGQGEPGLVDDENREMEVTRSP